MLALVFLVREQTLLLRGGEVAEGLQHGSRSCGVDNAEAEQKNARCPGVNDFQRGLELDKVRSRRNARNDDVINNKPMKCYQ